MSQPFIGEVRAFGFHFAPVGWALCDGRQLPIQQYAALFSVIGTYYGGNGTTTFALPNLQNSAPMHWGNGAGLTPTQIGQVQGQPSVTLQVMQLPPHNHMIQSAQGSGTQLVGTPGPTVWLGNSQPADAYLATNTLDSAFSPKAIGYQGGSQAHNNVQPLLAVNICIALNGIFPSRG
jgi:microcystin-dependent protein